VKEDTLKSEVEEKKFEGENCKITFFSARNIQKFYDKRKV